MEQHLIKKTYRISHDVSEDISAIAREKNAAENQVIETALKFYRDHHYMKHKAHFINDDLLMVFTALLDTQETKINHKTNQVLSSLAIEVGTLLLLMAQVMELDPLAAENARKTAVSNLKTNNRLR